MTEKGGRLCSREPVSEQYAGYERGERIMTAQQRSWLIKPTQSGLCAPTSKIHTERHCNLYMITPKMQQRSNAGLRMVASQYRNPTVFQLDAVGQLFTQNGQIFTQRRHNFAVVFAIILVVEIEYRLRDLEHARINLFCHADYHHAAFAIFGKMTVELEVGLRSVIDQGL